MGPNLGSQRRRNNAKQKKNVKWDQIFGPILCFLLKSTFFEAFQARNPVPFEENKAFVHFCKAAGSQIWSQTVRIDSSCSFGAKVLVNAWSQKANIEVYP